MQQPWEEGSAARKPQQPSAYPAYQPEQAYQPGQLYGCRPPVQSPPPMAAPAPEEPAYMQPPVFEQSPLQPGQPYGANAYFNGPKPLEEAFQTPAWPEEEEPEASQEEAPLRDPFSPADDPKPLKKIRKQPKKAKRPPVRVGRVLALVAAGMMILVCCVMGAQMLIALTQSERSFEEARLAYREEYGVELQAGAAKVELPPDGQTFPPTAPPTPTPYVPVATPPPRIPINEAAVLGLSGHDQNLPEAEVTPTPVLRTKLSTYPKNPLTNVHESLTELIKDNADVVGRLVIPGVLDEVVVKRNNTYYLSRNYLGVSSVGGAVFADELTSFRVPPENLLLRGQCSVPGKAFAPLLKYLSGGAGFAATAASCTLTTLYEQEQYVLFAVIQTTSDPSSPGYFNYASSPNFATDASMMNYVELARARSIYPFGVDVQPADRLLTLATVGGDSTLVLLFRMARENEMY